MMQCRAIKEMENFPEVSPIIALLLLTETICLVKSHKDPDQRC